MKRLRLNKRGVSPIIATLLLVAIAVAAAVVTYTWTMSLAQNNSQQAQTSIKIDHIMFGQGATESTTVAADPVPTLGGFTVASADDLDVGDFIRVYEAGVVDTTTQIATKVGSALTVEPDLTLIGGVVADVSGAVVTKISDGVLISIRNTGSIAATIDAAYIYSGDNLISTVALTTDNTVSSGSTLNIGINTANDEADWNTLTSGGLPLPAADTNIEDAVFEELFTTNKPYTIRLITSTGFVAEGTYYSPGSFS